MAAIRSVNGSTFRYGSVPDLVYPSSGEPIDWAKGVLNIDYPFGVYLRPNDSTANGVLLPPEQIIAAASETWAGIMVVVNQVASGQ